jgi:uncharacterized protein (UPF0276 family)
VGEDLPELGVGMVYFSGLEPLLEAHPEIVDLLEIEPQTTWLERPDRPGELFLQDEVETHLASLPYRKLVHSVGTPVGGSVRGIEAQLPLLHDCVKRWDAPWASEHLAFNLTSDFFTGFFLPPRQTDEGLRVYVPAIRQLASALDVPFAFETGVNYLRPRSDEIPDGEFVAQVAESADCGILLDLHNIYANQWNGRQAVEKFFKQIPLDRVWEIHVAGGFELDGYWLDAHSGAMPDAMLAIAREIIPQLPNLKAIVFEMFTSFLPHFGLDAIRGEIDRVRELWGLRRPGVLYVPEKIAPIELTRECEARIGVAEWETVLGRLVIGQSAENTTAMELRSDPGVELMRGLIHEFRASMVVGVYRLSCRLMMLVLTPNAFRAILEDFWQHHPPRQHAAAEAESFMDYLREKDVQWPQLAKVMEFEKAAMEALLSGQPKVVKFAADPFPMLRALTEGKLPEVIPQEGDFEIELKPEGPVTVTGINIEQVRGAFPFH